jgi:hypothetical protein
MSIDKFCWEAICPKASRKTTLQKIEIGVKASQC